MLSMHRHFCWRVNPQRIPPGAVHTRGVLPMRYPNIAITRSCVSNIPKVPCVLCGDQTFLYITAPKVDRPTIHVGELSQTFLLSAEVLRRYAHITMSIHSRTDGFPRRSSSSLANQPSSNQMMITTIMAIFVTIDSSTIENDSQPRGVFAASVRLSFGALCFSAVAWTPVDIFLPLEYSQNQTEVGLVCTQYNGRFFFLGSFRQNTLRIGSRTRHSVVSGSFVRTAVPLREFPLGFRCG